MRVLGLTLVLLVLLVPRSSGAQTCSGNACEGGPSLFLAMSLGVSAVAAVPAVVTGVGNGLAIARETRSATGWLVAGYVSAGLNFGAAAFAAGLLAQGGPREELALLIGSAVIGAGDLVLTILGHTAEPKAVARFLPRPALLWSPSGVPVVGLSTPVVSF